MIEIKELFNYFWYLKPSEFNPAEKVKLTTFLKKLKPIISYYEKNNSEATPEDAKKIFAS